MDGEGGRPDLNIKTFICHRLLLVTSYLLFFILHLAVLFGFVFTYFSLATMCIDCFTAAFAQIQMYYEVFLSMRSLLR